MNERRTAKKLVAYAGIRELTAKCGLISAFNSARVCAYEGVELLYIACECEGLIDKIEEIRVAISSSETSLRCISCYADVLNKSLPYEKNEDSIRAIKSCIDLACAVGCPFVHHTLVTRLSGGRDDYPEAFKVVLPIAEEIAEYAKGLGVTVLYEPHGMLFNGLDGYSKFFDSMLSRHENVGVCLDVGNTLWVDEDCYTLAEKYGAYIKHVHLKDYVLDSEDTTYRTLGKRTIKEVKLGEGIIDLKRVFDILKSAGYDGYLSIEDNSCSDFTSTARNAHEIVSKLTNQQTNF